MANSFDINLILAKAEDALRIASQRYRIKSVGFLSPYERAVIEEHINPPADVKTGFFGGYEGAERTMFVCVPKYTSIDCETIMSAVKITGREIGSLSHRDFLGSILALGIKRMNIGDIIVSEQDCTILVKPEIVNYIINNLTKIGRCGIKIEKCPINEVKAPRHETRELSGTVASLRLDSIVALAAGISRNAAAELIKAESVNVNFKPVCDLKYHVKSGDMLSIRRVGRIKVEKIGSLTRKGRTAVTLLKFL